MLLSLLLLFLPVIRFIMLIIEITEFAEILDSTLDLA